jgi:hypothetical protein
MHCAGENTKILSIILIKFPPKKMIKAHTRYKAKFLMFFSSDHIKQKVIKWEKRSDNASSSLRREKYFRTCLKRRVFLDPVRSVFSSVSLCDLKGC